MPSVVDTIILLAGGFLLGVVVVGYLAVTAWYLEKQRVDRYMADLKRDRQELERLRKQASWLQMRVAVAERRKRVSPITSSN